jgi:hypothetical protein
MRSILTLSTVREAKDYLRGAALTPQQAEDLIKRLKKEDRFGWARRVVAKVREADIGSTVLRSWFAQQHVLCTYKDPDLTSPQGGLYAMPSLCGSA